MFTTGDKLRVLNADSEVKVFTAAGVELTTAALAGGGTADYFRVDGFGTFKFSDINYLKCRRATAIAGESKDFTLVAPPVLNVGDAVAVSIRFKTSRVQGELTNDFIEGGRPIVFSTGVLSAVGVTDIRTAVVAAWNTYKAQFHVAKLPIEVAAGATTSQIRVTDNTGSGSLTIVSVELNRVAQGIAYSTPTPAVMATVITAGNTGIGVGKFLEESVRMATWAHVNPYGIDNATTQVDIRGLYTQVSFTINVDRSAENLGVHAAGEVVNSRHEFTLFLNEATMLGTNGAIARLTEAMVAEVSSPNVTFTGGISEVDGTLPSVARTEGLFLSTGVSTTTSALFVA